MNVLFATFDVFPLPKGASTHIAHVLRALSGRFERVHCAVLGHGDMPRRQEEGNIVIHRCLADHPNFLKRTEYFRDFMTGLLDRLAPGLDCVHFRDIWSGIPWAFHEAAYGIPAVFEVNGLPTVELPAHYPALARNAGLMARLRGMEDLCIGAADRIITVSRVTRRYLLSRGAREDRVEVIPNTAEIPEDAGASRAERGPGTVLYAGTLAPWQGIGTLIRAFSLMEPTAAGGRARLVLACSSRKNLKSVKKLVARHGIGDAVDIRIGLSREELFDQYRRAAVTVAPLTRSARNELQGCSPLKLIESMACGTPVIASRLPVCEEIVSDGDEGLLVTPDSPRALAAAMQRILLDPAERDAMGRAAGDRFRRDFGHDLWKERLYGAYDKIISENGG